MSYVNTFTKSTPHNDCNSILTKLGVVACMVKDQEGGDVNAQFETLVCYYSMDNNLATIQ